MKYMVKVAFLVECDDWRDIGRPALVRWSDDPEIVTQLVETPAHVELVAMNVETIDDCGDAAEAESEAP